MKNISNTEIVAYNEFRAQLETLRDFNNKAIFDYESPRGNKDARSHIYKLRKTKSAVEECRKKEKKASLEYGRKVDSEAKDIIFELDEMIGVHLAPITEIENREKRRIEHIRGLIEYLQTFEDNAENLDANAIEGKINQLKSIDILPDEYAEFTQEATAEKERVLSRLDSLWAKKKTQEAEQEELQRLRKESEERERREREERIAYEAAARAKQEAEDAARRKQKELQDAAERAEREKREAEQRAINAEKAAQDKIKREKEQEEQERKKREADRKHRASVNNAAVNALVTEGGIDKEIAKTVVQLIAKHEIPNIRITY